MIKLDKTNPAHYSDLVRQHSNRSVVVAVVALLFLAVSVRLLRSYGLASGEGLGGVLVGGTALLLPAVFYRYGKNNLHIYNQWDGVENQKPSASPFRRCHWEAFLTPEESVTQKQQELTFVVENNAQQLKVVGALASAFALLAIAAGYRLLLTHGIDPKYIGSVVGGGLLITGGALCLPEIYFWAARKRAEVQIAAHEELRGFSQEEMTTEKFLDQFENRENFTSLSAEQRIFLTNLYAENPHRKTPPGFVCAENLQQLLTEGKIVSFLRFLEASTEPTALCREILSAIKNAAPIFNAQSENVLSTHPKAAQALLSAWESTPLGGEGEISVLSPEQVLFLTQLYVEHPTKIIASRFICAENLRPLLTAKKLEVFLRFLEASGEPVALCQEILSDIINANTAFNLQFKDKPLNFPRAIRAILTVWNPVGIGSTSQDCWILLLSKLSLSVEANQALLAPLQRYEIHGMLQGKLFDRNIFTAAILQHPDLLLAMKPTELTFYFLHHFQDIDVAYHPQILKRLEAFQGNGDDEDTRVWDLTRKLMGLQPFLFSEEMDPTTQLVQRTGFVQRLFERNLTILVKPVFHIHYIGRYLLSLAGTPQLEVVLQEIKAKLEPRLAQLIRTLANNAFYYPNAERQSFEVIKALQELFPVQFPQIIGELANKTLSYPHAVTAYRMTLKNLIKFSPEIFLEEAWGRDGLAKGEQARFPTRADLLFTQCDFSVQEYQEMFKDSPDLVMQCINALDQVYFPQKLVHAFFCISPKFFLATPQHELEWICKENDLTTEKLKHYIQDPAILIEYCTSLEMHFILASKPAVFVVDLFKALQGDYIINNALPNHPSLQAKLKELKLIP